MRRIVIATFALVVLLSAASYATQTRTLVMGDNNMIMVDDANMFLFPGRAFNYPNLALGEVAYGDLFQFGVTWQFNEDNPWVLGTFVSNEPVFGAETWNHDIDLFSFPWYNLPWWVMGTATGAEAQEQLDTDYPRRLEMFYARQLGGMNFGFHFDLVRQSWKAEHDSDAVIEENWDAKQSFSQYNFGLGLTEGTSGQWDIAAHFLMGSWTNENQEGKTINEPSGFYDFAIGGRLFHVMNPKVTLVPHVGFTMGKRGVEEFDNYEIDSTWDDTKDEYSRTAFDIGCGFNYTPGAGMLGVFDFGVMYESVKGEFTGDRSGNHAIDPNEEYETKTTDLVLPYMKIGVEGEVFSWMDFRAGATAAIFINQHKDEHDLLVDQTWDTPMNETYLGLGFNFGRLHLDTYMNPSILTDGLYFINGDGDDTEEELNFQVTALYELF